MPDEVFSQAADEVNLPEAQVPDQNVASTAGKEEPQTEKALTLEDYRKIAREEALRAAQSQVAKGENRIQKFIQDQFRALEQSRGVLKLSEDQVAQAKRDIVAKAYEEASPDAEASTNDPQADPEQFIRQQAEFVYSQIGAVLQEHGVEITPNDPEFKTVQAALDDPQGSFSKTILAANKAAQAKAARIAQKKDGAAGRVAGGGPVQGTTTKTLTAEEKISKGLQGDWQSQTPTPRRTTP